MFKRISLSVLFAVLFYGLALAVPPVQITHDDGTPLTKGKSTTSTLTMNATTTQYSTVESSGSYDKLAFFVNYDETEHVGAVKTYHIAAAGTGYATNDVLTITGGSGGDCTLKVTAVSGDTVLTTTSLTQGLGYSAGDTQATTVAPSGGSNCTIHVTAIGAALSEAVSLEISPDNSTWQAASFYDYAGGATLQTSETLSADGNYYLWTNKDLASPYTRVKIVATNSEAADTIVNTIVSSAVDGL
jgi:hypothetical protein